VASTITFSVQVGSGGFAIARAVSEQLGFRYYDWEVTSQAAEMAGVSPDVVAASERVPGFLERMMRRLSAAPALSSEEALLEPAPNVVGLAVQSLTSDDYRQFIERVVVELADKGDAVIVGHAGQAVLAERHNVLKVLVLGSIEKRAERLAVEQRIAVNEALATIKQSDKERTELFRRAYHIDWLDASTYDVCVNTDRITPEVAVESVVAAARLLG
jgi:cytidylate kinase